MTDLDATLKLLQVVGIVGAAVLFVFRLGGKMDRLALSIDHLASVLEDHEDRLRALEQK